MSEEIKALNLDELGAVSGGKSQGLMATKTGANIRSGPGLKFDVIAKTTKGATAVYAGETRMADGITWLRVSWGSKTGWISSEYVKKI